MAKQLEFYFPKTKSKHMATPVTGKVYPSKGGTVRYGVQASMNGSMSLPKYVKEDEFYDYGFGVDSVVRKYPQEFMDTFYDFDSNPTADTQDDETVAIAYQAWYQKKAENEVLNAEVNVGEKRVMNRKDYDIDNELSGFSNMEVGDIDLEDYQDEITESVEDEVIEAIRESVDDAMPISDGESISSSVNVDTELEITVPISGDIDYDWTANETYEDDRHDDEWNAETVSFHGENYQNHLKVVKKAPYGGIGSLFGIGGDTELGGFSTSELTGSSAIHGDFDSASLNYSGHQNIVSRAEEYFGWVITHPDGLRTDSFRTKSQAEKYRDELKKNTSLRTGLRIVKANANDEPMALVTLNEYNAETFEAEKLHPGLYRYKGKIGLRKGWTECQECDDLVKLNDINWYYLKGYGQATVCDSCVGKYNYKKDRLSKGGRHGELAILQFMEQDRKEAETFEAPNGNCDRVWDCKNCERCKSHCECGTDRIMRRSNMRKMYGKTFSRQDTLCGYGAESVGSPSPSSPLEEVPATVPSPAEPTNESFNAEIACPSCGSDNWGEQEGYQCRDCNHVFNPHTQLDAEMDELDDTSSIIRNQVGDMVGMVELDENDEDIEKVDVDITDDDGEKAYEGTLGAETFEAEHRILSYVDYEHNDDPYTAITILLTDDSATIENANEIIDNLVDEHGYDPYTHEGDKDLTIYFKDIRGKTLRTLNYNVKGNKANGAIFEWFSDYDYPIGGYTAETYGVEESCMICSNPPVLKTQWGHTVCGDDDCRIKAMNMIRRENVICDCGKTMKPVGDGYYECNACYDNKYIGDVEFGAETFEAKGEELFDCFVCDKTLYENDDPQDDELCNDCLNTHKQCSVCQDYEPYNEMTSCFTCGQNYCGACDKYDSCEEYDAETFESQGMNTKMILGITALAVGLGLWKGKEILSISEKIRQSMKK